MSRLRQRSQLVGATIKIIIIRNNRLSAPKRLDLEKIYGKHGLDYKVEVRNRFGALGAIEAETPI